jgi:CheY-like chemotaxis protein
MLRKILIIEDEPEIQAILAMSLQRSGEFETALANDGVEGIECAQRDHPDVILLDVVMPRLDGYATCRRLKADRSLRHIPVVFLTAKCDRPEVERAMDAGGAGCVAKPFDPLKLAGQISEIACGGDYIDRQARPRHPHRTQR